MINNFLFTLLGVATGWLISQIYARRSSRELQEHFGGVSKILAEQSKYMEGVASLLITTHPEIANQIIESIKTNNYPEFNLGIFVEGESCPFCKTGKVRFVRWGVGPLGNSNAWFGCSNCNHVFQTQESSGD